MEASRPCLLSSLEFPRWPPTTFSIQSSMTLLPERIYAVQLARDERLEARGTLGETCKYLPALLSSSSS